MLPDVLVDEILDLVFERGDVTDLVHVRCLCKAIAQRASHALAALVNSLRTPQEAALLFPGLSKFATASLLRLEPRAAPTVWHFSFARQRCCCFCGKRYAGGFRLFAAQDGGMLLYAHDDCIRERTVSLHYVNGRQFLEGTTRGLRAQARLNQCWTSLIPLLLKRNVDPSRMTSLAVLTRASFSRHYGPFVYDVAFPRCVPGAVPRRHTLIGGLYDTDEETRAELDAHCAWERHFEEQRAAAAAAHAQKKEDLQRRREAARERRAAWLQDIGAQHVQQVDTLFPFSKFVGPAAAISNPPKRQRIVEALSVLPEFLRIRDDAVLTGLITPEEADRVGVVSVEAIRSLVRDKLALEDKQAAARREFLRIRDDAVLTGLITPEEADRVGVVSVEAIRSLIRDKLAAEDKKVGRGIIRSYYRNTL